MHFFIFCCIITNRRTLGIIIKKGEVMKTYTQTFVGLLIILFFSSCSSWLPTTDSVSGGDGGADDATTGDNLIPVSMTMSSQTTQAIASAIPQISAALPAALPALKAIKKASTVEKVILACLFIPKSIDELLAKKDCILAYDEMSADDFLKGGKFGFSVCRDIKFDLCGLGGLLSDGSAQVWVELPTKNFKPKGDFDFGEITFKDGGFKVSEAVLSEITTLESENEREEDFDIPNFQGAYTIAISTSGANITASTVLKSNEQAKNAKEETAVTLCPNGELAKKGSVTIIDGEIFEGVYVVPEEKRVTIVTEETNPTLVKGCDEIVTTKAVIICDDSDCKKSSGFLKQLTKLDGKTCKNKTNEYNVVSNAFTATKAGADCLLTARTAATGATGGAAASTESQSFSITIPNSYGYIGSSWSSIESSKLGGYIEQVIGKNPETAPVSLLITMNADKTEASYSIKGSEVSGTVKLSGDQYGLYGSDSKSIKTGLYQIYLWSYFDYVTKANKLSGDLELTNADALYVLEDSDDFMTYSMFAEDQAKTEEYNTYAYSYTYSNDYAVPEAEAQATAQTLTSDLCSSYPSGNISDFSQAMQNEINALSLFLPENSKYLLTLEIVSSEVFIATFTTSDGRSIVLDLSLIHI